MRNLSQSTRFNEFSFRLTSHALVAIMITCAALTLLSLIDRLLPGWQPLYLPVLCFLTALERLYTYKRFEKLELFSKEWVTIFVSEWVVIILILKVVTGLMNGLPAFLEEIPKWFLNLNHYFFTNEFVFAIALVMITWVISGSFAGLLNEMDITQVLLLEIDPGQGKGKLPARQRLVNLILSLGTVLVILTALARLDIRTFLSQTNTLLFTSMPALAGGGASTLLYFMFGIALLSQTRFIDLQTRWSVQHIPVNHRLGRNWTLYSLIFLGIVTALVVMLPTRYSLWTIDIIGQGMGLIATVLFFLAQGIMTLFVFLITLPFVLFGKNPEAVKKQFPTQGLPSTETILQTTTSPAWWTATKPVLFWGIILAVLLFSIIHYLRQHKEILDLLRKRPVVSRFLRFINWLINRFVKIQVSLKKTLKIGQPRVSANNFDGHSQIAFSPLRRLNTRQKIIFFYLALVRRGDENGLPRHPSQTPYEYASKLEASLPEVEKELSTLTNAFVDARYSSQPVEPDQVNLVKNTWDRIRKVFRRKK